MAGSGMAAFEQLDGKADMATVDRDPKPSSEMRERIILYERKEAIVCAMPTRSRCKCLAMSRQHRRNGRRPHSLRYDRRDCDQGNAIQHPRRDTVRDPRLLGRCFALS